MGRQPKVSRTSRWLAGSEVMAWLFPGRASLPPQHGPVALSPSCITRPLPLSWKETRDDQVSLLTSNKNKAYTRNIINCSHKLSVRNQEACLYFSFHGLWETFLLRIAVAINYIHIKWI